MEGENTEAAEVAGGAGEQSTAGSLLRLPWLGRALAIVAAIGVIAKILGVVVYPGMVGIASQGAIDRADLASSTFSYAFALLAVGLIGAGAYELSRVRGIGIGARGAVIGLSALVVAFSAPAITHRLLTIPTIALAIVSSIISIIGAATALRAAPTRILGAVIALFALAAVVRPISWELTMVASEQASMGMYTAGKMLAATALVLQALATLLAAAWLGTRSPVRGRLLANGAIVIAFAVTYLAARENDSPSTLQAVLRSSLSQASDLPLPFALTSIAAFLVTATLLLALVALVQRAAAPAVLASLAFALLSQGALDVPLQALAMVAACQWGILAMADPRSLWSAMTAGRERGQRVGV